MATKTVASINWNTTKAEDDVIRQIVDRAFASTVHRPYHEESKQALVMDIVCVHKNVFPLRLKDWLEADAFNFTHDVVGIQRHIDRTTGELRNCFVPRFAEHRKR